ncbi:XkdX family protein [Clostridium lundense]|nr:XkdX family protein [Clostridium lundense]
MFNFYNLFYGCGYLKIEDLKEATKWNVISKEEFKTITGEEFITQ